MHRFSIIRQLGRFGMMIPSMIADSPYQNGGLLLTPREGIFEGIFGCLAMLSLWKLSPFNAFDFILFLGNGFFGAGMTLFLTLGGVGGLLHALCQQRGPRIGLFAVGLFYGIMLWVASRILSHLFWRPLSGYSQQLWWFLAHIVYGACLGASAWTKSRRLEITAGLKD